MNGGLRMVNLGIVQPCGENKENGGDGENEKRRGRTRRSGENEKDWGEREAMLCSSGAWKAWSDHRSELGSPISWSATTNPRRELA